jgi:hypothetical protein
MLFAAGRESLLQGAKATGWRLGGGAGSGGAAGTEELLAAIAFGRRPGYALRIGTF